MLVSPCFSGLIHWLSFVILLYCSILNEKAFFSSLLCHMKQVVWLRDHTVGIIKRGRQKGSLQGS